MDDYRPTLTDLREMDCVQLSIAATEIANHVRRFPALYAGYKNDLLEISFQACRAVEAIETAKF